jgi:hypothetical protein
VQRGRAAAGMVIVLLDGVAVVLGIVPQNMAIAESKLGKIEEGMDAVVAEDKIAEKTDHEVAETTTVELKDLGGDYRSPSHVAGMPDMSLNSN